MSTVSVPLAESAVPKTSVQESPIPDSLAAGISAVQASLSEFHEQRLAWEQDFVALLDDFEDLAIEAALAAQARHLERPTATPPAEVIAAPADPRHDEWLLELASQQESLAKQHRETTCELSTVRELVEQQTELLTAFISAATEWAPKSASVPHRSDPVLNSVQAEFAQLKPAASPAASRGKSSRSGAA